MSGPLTGFKIVDVCRARPGQWATGFLADYGADVISISDPGYAAQRAQGGAISQPLGRVNGRNKRSILLNLRQDSAREVLFELVKRADAFLESNRPGVAKRLGIDYASLKAVNPVIVYCSLSGFGQYGAYAAIPAHDLGFQAVAGMLPQDETGRPLMPRSNHADFYGAHFVAMALLMALLERSRSGEGQYIDMSFTDVSVTVPPGRHPDEVFYGRYPAYNIFETKDGRYVALAIRETKFWERLCKLLGREDYIPYVRPEGRLRDEMFAAFRAAFKERTLAEWRTALQTVDTAFGPVNRTTAELLADPHIKARGMVIELTDPLTGEPTYEPGFPLKFSRTPGTLRRGPSLMGVDGDEILAELGHSPEQIAALRMSGALR
ncbi:MAG: CoA transferase [Chloroflexota bacterium]|nr:CoA transferase [Chloroflexota bacterium]